MNIKPIAKTDYTYCINEECSQKSICARYFKNYIMKKSAFYTFCKFEEKTCIESEVNNEPTGAAETNN